MKRLQNKIRAALAASPDGLSCTELTAALGVTRIGVRQSLPLCFGVYVDRWRRAAHGSLEAVYCVVDVPGNCPKPTKETK